MSEVLLVNYVYVVGSKVLVSLQVVHCVAGSDSLVNTRVSTCVKQDITVNTQDCELHMCMPSYWYYTRLHNSL